MQRFLCALCLTVGLATSSAAQDEPDAEVIEYAEGVVEDLNIAFPPLEEESIEDEPMTAGQVLWAESFGKPGSASVQLRLQNDATQPDASGWIEILDGSGELVERIEGARLAQEGEIWTNLALGSFIELIVVGDAGTNLSFRISGISYEKSGARQESIIDWDDRKHIIEYTGPLSAILPTIEGAVAKLSYIKIKNGFSRRYVCTGFLISDNLLLTNEHCVNTAEICATTKVLFGYSVNKFGIARPREQVRCTAVEKVSFPLDYALLRLEGTPGQRWGKLALSSTSVKAGQKIFVIQHPAGEAKQISEIDCAVVQVPVSGRGTNTDLSHSCDTLTGSSGSPVFDDKGRVIGLHHLAKQPTGQFSNVNRAVLISSIAKEISP